MHIGNVEVTGNQAVCGITTVPLCRNIIIIIIIMLLCCHNFTDL